MNTLFKPDANTVYTLPPTLSWPEATQHQFDESDIWAVQAAMAANRPLLVRGEPGVGKSQLARAAAHTLMRPLLCEVVHARCECHDLLFRFDAVARLAKAQVVQASGGYKVDDVLKESRFLVPGVLWWAFDWQSALDQVSQCEIGCDVPKALKDYKWTPDKGCVVLIDEIDKADTDVPNALLEALGNGGFHVPFSQKRVRMAEQQQAKPLVIVTTNEERELPAAFVRRCLVLQMRLQREHESTEDALLRRGRAHFPPSKVPDDVCRKAAAQLVKDREDAKKQDLPRPGHAEYLDVLRALSTLYPNGLDSRDEQLKALQRIAELAFRKQTLE